MGGPRKTDPIVLRAACGCADQHALALGLLGRILLWEDLLAATRIPLRHAPRAAGHEDPPACCGRPVGDGFDHAQVALLISVRFRSPGLAVGAWKNVIEIRVGAPGRGACTGDTSHATSSDPRQS